MNKEDFLVKLGQHIKAIRKEKGLSIRDIELNTDLTRQYISNIELGKINTSVFKLKRIADALGIEFADLFKGFKV